MRKQETIIFGVGKRGRRLVELLPVKEAVILVDSNPNKQGTKVYGHEVMLYSENNNFFENARRICITILDEQMHSAIEKELSKYKIPFISYNELIIEYIYEGFVVNCRKRATVVSHNTVVIAAANGVSFGGIESWVCDLTLGLVEAGYNVRIATLKPETIENYHIKQYIDMICDSTVIESREQVEKILCYYLAQQPVALITTQPNLFLQCAKAMNQSPKYIIRTIATIHGCNSYIIKLYKELYFPNLLYVGCAKEIPCELIKLGIAESQVCSMKIPFECEQELVRSYTMDKRLPLKIGWAGRLHSIKPTDQKRLDYLLQYAKMLVDMKVNFILEIAGDGLARKEFEKLGEKLGVAKKVHMCGYLERKEIHNFWRRQDICVLSSDLEGRSISVLEAMGNGVVPVVTAVSGVREDIIDGHNGFIVEIGDYKALAERTIYLEQHRELLPLMGGRAHDMIYPKSKQDTHIKFWVKLIENSRIERT